MKFSVIVIAYNQKDTICTAIDSVLRQTHQDLEVIYVDDASTDGSAALVKASFSDSRLRVIEHKENQGCVISRLDGAVCACGDWVMFLDGDDSFREDACAVLEETIRNAQPGLDCVGFGFELFYTGPTEKAAKNEIERLAAQPYLGYLSGEELMEHIYLERDKAWLICNKCYSRPLILKLTAAAKREKLVHLEDFYLSYLICDMTERYLGIPEQLYRYAFGSGISSSQKLSYNAFIQYLTSRKSPELAAEYAKSRGLFDKYSSVFENVAREVMLGSYYKLCRIADEDKPAAAQRYVETFGEQLEQMYYALRGKTAEVEESRGRIRLLEDDLRQKYGELDACRTYIQKLERDIQIKDRDLDECRTYIQKLETQLRQQEEKICNQQQLLQEIYNSRAYRLMKAFLHDHQD